MDRRSTRWLRILLVAGALLAVALLVQTVINYQYVSSNLLLQEARRIADERVHDVERAARLARPADAEAFRALLDDVRADSADQVAGLALVARGGAVIAASGQTSASSPSDEQPGLVGRDQPMRREWRAGHAVLVGLLPCRCGLPRRAADAPNQSPDTGPLRLEVGLYEDSLSAPFSRVRRNAIVSASAALTLLVALSLIAARAGAYLRGKELETQVELARLVQTDLLPSDVARPPGIDVAAEYLPASHVGGDFYDIVTLPGSRVSFVLGDVSGHGIASALLMGLLHGAMSSPPWGASEDPDRAAARLNELLRTKTSGARFASLFWCGYDPSAHTLRYLNAGHPPPFLLHQESDGVWRVERLADGGPVLGILASAAYRTVSVSASDGDLLVLYSDGITEAPNGRGEQFGETRLIEVARTAANRSARAACDAILAAVNEFTGDRPAPDDQTLLVVRLWPNKAPTRHG